MLMHLKKTFLTEALLASSLFLTPLYANTLIPPPPVAFPVVTNGANNNTVEILFNGQVNATGSGQDAIWVNSGVGPGVTNGGNILVNAGNTQGVNAIVADTNKVGVFFKGFGVLPNGTLTIQGGSGINTPFAGSDAVVVDNQGVQITNAGTIQASQSAIFITANGLGTRVENQLGGVIQNVVGGLDHTIFSQPGAAGASLILNNAGTISQSSAGFDTIQLQSVFGTMTNHAGGIIQNTGALLTNNAINIVNPSSNGDTINEKGGLIFATGLGQTIVAGGDLGTINNAGSLRNLGTGSVIALNKLNANNTVDGIINSGEIFSNNPALAAIVNLNHGTTITHNLVNTGTINCATAGNAAIDFQTKITHTAVIQNDGVISGNIFLAQDDATLGSKVFTMNGGVIAGNVVGATFAGNIFTVNDGTLSGQLIGNGGAANTFDLSGGQIAGPIFLGNFGDTVNLTGTDTTLIIGGTGNDEFNVTGGSFTSLEGGAGLNKLHINKTFTTDGAINNVQIIDINNAKTTFTTNGPITNMNTSFTINALTTWVPNNLVQGQGDILNNGKVIVKGSPLIDLSPGIGSFIHSGLLVLKPDGLLTIQGNPTTAVVFESQPKAVITPQIAGLKVPGDVIRHGELVVNSALPNSVLLDSGSFIAPSFTGFLPQGTLINVITEVGSGTISDNAMLRQPLSTVIAFRKIDNPSINTTQVQLEVLRNSYSNLSETGITAGVANTLDGLAQGNGPNNPALLNLLGQLDSLTSRPDVESAMRSLVPPFNYGLIAGSFLGMKNTFESVQLRIEDLYARKILWLDQNVAPANGFNFGDPADGYSGWVKILGAYLDQRERDYVEGYRAKGVGMAFGADWGVNNCTTFGLAGSFTRVNVDDKDLNPKNQSIRSWQGTAYGWWEFCDGWYLDAMLGIASNRYKLDRHIHVNQIEAIANANFRSKQYGAQLDLGWSYANEEIYYLVPFARLRYIRLNLGNYQEYGVGDLNLIVQNKNVSEFLGGLGFRTGTIIDNGEVSYVPEVTVLLGYDFENQGQQTVAGFFGGGTAFTTNGIKPGRGVVDIALGLNVHFMPDSIFAVKYNLEARKEFCGNALYFQYNYLWD